MDYLTVSLNLNVSLKVLRVKISPGGTHQASPLACSIGPGGQNLARACPQVFLASFCSWLPVLTLFSHLGLGVGCFLSQLAFWWVFAAFGQLACLPSGFLAPRGGWALGCGAFVAALALSWHPNPNMQGVAWAPKRHFLKAYGHLK